MPFSKTWLLVMVRYFEVAIINTPNENNVWLKKKIYIPFTCLLHLILNLAFKFSQVYHDNKNCSRSCAQRFGLELRSNVNSAFSSITIQNVDAAYYKSRDKSGPEKNKVNHQGLYCSSHRRTPKAYKLHT